MTFIKVRDFLWTFVGVPLLAYSLFDPDPIPKIDEFLTIIAIIVSLAAPILKQFGVNIQTDEIERKNYDVIGKTWWVIALFFLFLIALSGSYQNWNAMSGWFVALIILIVYKFNDVMLRRKN